MDMKLEKEKEHLVLENQRLVHYLVQKFGVTPDSQEYEDIISTGMIALVKAAITFDSSKKYTFSTYASKCINNEILTCYREVKKHSNDISLEEIISDNEEESNFTLKNIIENPESNFVDELLNQEDFIQYMSIILNCLKGKKRAIMLYEVGGLRQINIARRMNLSRSYVQRIIVESIKLIRMVYDNQVEYKEEISMAVVGDEYKILFSSKDVRNFNQIFATLLQNLTSTEDLPDFKVSCNKERIVVQIPAHPESFSFIAQIIQNIDDFSMTYVSNKNPIPANNTVVQKNETKEAEEATDAKTDTNKKNCQIKVVRDYMLSKGSFTIKDLKDHFPNLPVGTINNAVYLAKKKGIITSLDRGSYIINKK